MSSCTVIVTLAPLPGKTDAVIQAINAEIEDIRLAEGCELYDMYRRVDDVIVLIERWSTRETWQAHFDTPAIGRLKGALTPLLAKPADRWELYSAGE